MRKAIALAVLVALAFSGWLVTKVVLAKRQAVLSAETPKLSVPVQVVPATTDTLEEGFVADGTVQAVNEVGVYSKASGKIARLNYDEGDWVPKGALVAELDRAQLVAQANMARASLGAAKVRAAQARRGYELQTVSTSTGVEQAKANLAAAQARLAQAKQNASLTSADVSTSMSSAEEAVRVAQANLDKLKAGARTQERQIAEEAVTQAKANLDTSAANLDRARRLLTAQAVSQQQYDATKLQYDVALAQYKTAQQQASLTDEGARTEDVRAAEATLAQAQAGLDKAKAMQLQVDIRKQDVDQAQEGVRQAESALKMAQASDLRDTMSIDDVKAADAAVGQAQASLEMAKAAVDDTYIYAPMAGWVTRRNVRAGEMASSAVPILDLVDNREVKVVCPLSEIRRRYVRLGQPVQVAVDAVPGKVFTGHVYTISASANQDARAFNMEVRLPNPRQELKSGMFARVRVTMRTQKGVVVPYDALLLQGGRQVVYVADNSVARARAVQPGLRQVDRVVIETGVKPGDLVIVQGQTEVKDGEAVSLEDPQGGAQPGADASSAPKAGGQREGAGAAQAGGQPEGAAQRGVAAQSGVVGQRKGGGQ